MPPSLSKSLVWFRRDLRDYDHAALSLALQNSVQVYTLFVFDVDILSGLPRQDRRVEFIWHSVQQLQRALRARGGGLLVRIGRAHEVVPQVAHELGVEAVFANRDYEPAARERDAAVQASLLADGRQWHACKDQVLFEERELLTGAGRPYTVFTPYSRAWLQRLQDRDLQPHPVQPWLSRLAAVDHHELPTLEQLGFSGTDLLQLGVVPGMQGAEQRLQDFLPRIEHYQERRDYPALKGPSWLSVHLRFGTLSIRQCVALARTQPGPGARTWLNELIWRDFYAQILANFPHVVEHSFKADYRELRFPDPAGHFEAWCAGRTGYPLVDAAMTQLNRTGYMHNRLRMVTASFLVKDLLVDWRHGERYFAEKLLDFDLASNNGGWQWAASTGCDAQPYFRIFNPVSQSEKFDPQGRFIRRYLPQLADVPDRWLHAPWTMPPLQQQACGVVIGRDYPPPLVDHALMRQQALALYGKERTTE